MQFKRWRLSNAHPFVNAGLGLILLLGAIACSGDKKVAETEDSGPVLSTASLELPAVWATSSLEGEVAAIGLSGGFSGLLAVAYKSGGIELFNMEADRVGERSNFRLNALADGYSTIVDDSQITIFPGVTRDGELKAYIYGDLFIAPTEIDLPIEETRSVEGICSGPAEGDGVLRLGYWTITNNRVLKSGTIRMTDGDLSWHPSDPMTSETAIQSCSVAAAAPSVSDIMMDSARLERADFSAGVQLREDGRLIIRTEDEIFSDISVRDGITVIAPDEPVAMSAIGTPRAGGYPGGVIVIAGETKSGDHQAVFIDPSVLTLAEDE
jgi:hypothetical protein